MWLPLGLLVAGFAGLLEADIYKKGGKAVLSPGCVSEPITRIMWKHGLDIAAEWYGNETEAFRGFRGRSVVDITTGALRISNLSLKDSGTYTAEINGINTGTTKITVITAVPKPTIIKHCIPEETQCTLTCEASITDDTGRVTYSWEIDHRQRPSSSKQLNITKNDTESVGKRISCQLTNPVSRERSDDIFIMRPNRSSEGMNVAAVTVPPVLIVLSMVLAGLVFCHKCRPENADTSCCHYCARFDPRSLNRGGAPLAQAQSNGVETLSGVQETPAQHLTSVVLPETTSEPESTVIREPELEEATEDQRFLHTV